MNSTSLIRAATGTVLVAIALGLGGCASVQTPVPTGNADNVTQLKAMGATQQVAVGDFTASGAAVANDKGISVRGANSMAPAGGSFARQLRDQLAADLKSAGLYSEGAKVVVTGVMTDNQLDAGMSKGTGRVAARFKVVSGGATVFEKELVAQSEWESSFVGAVAVPAAFNHHGALMTQLVGKLIADPQFRAAVGAK